MKRAVTGVALVVLMAFVLGIGLGAKAEPNVHPIFSALQVDQQVDLRPLPSGRFLIRNWGGIDRIQTLGPDYVIVTSTSNVHYIHISQIQEVLTRK